MTKRAVLLALFTIVGGSTGNPASEPSLLSDRKVAESMLDMRLMGALLEAYRLEFGTYPADDGQLRSLKAVLKREPEVYRQQVKDNDAWGTPLQYRANEGSYQLISFGADRHPERRYEMQPIRPGQFSEITEAGDETSDLVLIDGRFVQRPFSGQDPAFITINAMNRIFVAAAAFAVDNNRFPGDTSDFVPVAELASDLVPVFAAEVPDQDGWGKPLLYFSNGASFVLASFGADAEPDRTYYPDLACGLPWYDAGPGPGDAADIVQANGQFAHWPKGTEP